MQTMPRLGRRSILWIAASLALLLLAGWLWRNRTRYMVEMGEPAVAVYVTRKPTKAEVDANFTGAKYEPRYGCYLGAYIDLEPALTEKYKDVIGRVRTEPAEFEKRVGKEHALYFFYLGYGQKLPIDWVKKLASQGKFVQIALEPNKGLAEVQDNAYLRTLADDIKKSGAKVFLRFASEMNGTWVKYHGDPALYIEKWRLLTRVMRERAPNVAMLWCPYMTPKGLIEGYYPGDEYVDWVGVNAYSVIYYNMDRRYPGHQDHPADMVRYVYDQYAARKPMMICEYGAANYSAVEGRDVDEFAIECIRSLYWTLPRRFPRIKCVTYFSVNNMLLSHRKNNDYSLLGKQQIRSAYADAISPEYYLSGQSDSLPVSPMEVRGRAEIPSGSSFSVWARSPERWAEVKAVQGNITEEVGAGVDGLQFSSSASGPWVVEAYNREGEKVASTSVQLFWFTRLPAP